MNKTFMEFGRKLLDCPSKECHGHENMEICFCPRKGIFPRGLIVSPADANPEDIKLIILGQNPGQASAYERALYREYSKKDEGFVKLNKIHLEALRDHPYSQRALDLAKALWEGEKDPLSVLFLETVYCESQNNKVPRSKTKMHCAKQHLVKHLEALSKRKRNMNAIVICIGGQAKDWFKKYGPSNKFRWCYVPHFTGCRGSFQKYCQNGSLTDNANNAKKIWESVKAGNMDGECLSPIHSKKVRRK